MRHYTIQNVGGVPHIVEQPRVTGEEPSMITLADNLNLPLARASFIRLLPGQYLVLRAECEEPSAA